MKKLLTLFILKVALLPEVDLARAQSGAREAGYLYLSPVPSAPYVSAQTRYVLLRFEHVVPSEVTNLTTSFITVTGANSGPHSGLTHVASDGRTVMFEMSEDFSQNELVTVILNPHLTGAAVGKLAPYAYQFMITARMPGSSSPSAVLPSAASVSIGYPAEPQDLSNGPAWGTEPAEDKALATTRIMPNGVSVPSDFPTAVITVNDNPSPGYLFLKHRGQASQYYWMILDNHGSPVWYRRGEGLYFKVQENGLITIVDSVVQTTAYDQNFNYVRSYRPVNGYRIDNHELEVLEDGTYLMLGYRENTVDMSQYVAGGVTNATVVETVIQKFTAADELIFQWRAWDHYDVGDVLGGVNLMNLFHFSHMNALDVDADGHLLLSSRELSEVTKIHRDSGDIIWRLGGNHTSFVFSNDPLNGFSFQHDINALGHDRYMVFDNGNGHHPPVSRAVEFQLDLTNMTATKVWQYRETPDKFTWVMGNAQRLPSGNTLINFVQGDYPAVIEVDTNGIKQFELNLIPNDGPVAVHYQTFRFPWNGVVAVPYLILEPDTTGLNLVFNKFGDPNVSYYRIYGGTSPRPTVLLATSTTTLKHLSSLENGHRYYFRVTAVNGQGMESDYSNEENLTINIIKPGEQMILNGDFTLGTNSWTFAAGGAATAIWNVTNGTACIDITSPGTLLAGVQLRQAGMRLVQGRQYVFQFDAWSYAPRPIEARLLSDQSPSTTYKVATPFLTSTRQHFSYPFTMAHATDVNAHLAFNLGVSPIDVYLDNVSLFMVAPGDFNRDKNVNLDDLSVFTGQWLRQGGGFTADVNADGKVDFKDLALLGEGWSGRH